MRALTAAEVVNTYDEKALTRVLREFGEERFAGRIAAQIVRRRAQRPFATTGELVELLYQAIPAPARRTGGHPAKRTFQALRIAVNGELDSLRDALPAALGALAPGGRIVVMAYQSLEDRIVKSQFAAATASRTPPGLPVELPGHEPEFVALTRGAERAGAAEIELNPRSASVRLRALEKVAEGKTHEGQAKPAAGTRRRRAAAATSRNASPPPRREAPPRRRKPTREQRPQRSAPADQPDPAAHRRAGPAEERQSGQGAGEGAKGQGAQGRSATAA